jgi:hypothetical protein
VRGDAAQLRLGPELPLRLGPETRIEPAERAGASARSPGLSCALRRSAHWAAMMAGGDGVAIM